MIQLQSEITDSKSQGHKIANIAKRKSRNLTFGGSNKPTGENTLQLIEASPADFQIRATFSSKTQNSGAVFFNDSIMRISQFNIAYYIFADVLFVIQ